MENCKIIPDFGIKTQIILKIFPTKREHPPRFFCAKINGFSFGGNLSLIWRWERRLHGFHCYTRVQSGVLVLLNATRQCLFVEIQAIRSCSSHSLKRRGSASCVRWKALSSSLPNARGDWIPGGASAQDALGKCTHHIILYISRSQATYQVAALEQNIISAALKESISRWLKFAHIHQIYVYSGSRNITQQAKRSRVGWKRDEKFLVQSI